MVCSTENCTGTPRAKGLCPSCYSKKKYIIHGAVIRARVNAARAAETPEQRTSRLRKNRNWAAKNPERQKELHTAWIAANPERNRQQKAKWDRANLDARRITSQNRRARECGAGGSFTKQEWQELCTVFGNRCPACNRTDVKLTADHIVPVSLGGSSNIDNIQPLCGPCNSSKGARIIHYCSL